MIDISPVDQSDESRTLINYRTWVTWLGFKKKKKNENKFNIISNFHADRRGSINNNKSTTILRRYRRKTTCTTSRSGWVFDTILWCHTHARFTGEDFHRYAHLRQKGFDEKNNKSLPSIRPKWWNIFFESDMHPLMADNSAEERISGRKSNIT